MATAAAVRLPPVTPVTADGGAPARLHPAHALELAELSGDDAAIAQAALDASTAAEREGRWAVARSHVERARRLFVQLGDVFGVARALSTAGRVDFLLGDVDDARRNLRQSFAILVDLGRDVEAAQAVSSLAHVQLRTGELEDAERLARRALVFIGSRSDQRTELGSAQLVLGRALLALGRADEADAAFGDADRALEGTAVAERAPVWLAQGDAATHRGDAKGAAELYRRAAEALQDFRF